MNSVRNGTQEENKRNSRLPVRLGKKIVEVEAEDRNSENIKKNQEEREVGLGGALQLMQERHRALV